MESIDLTSCRVLLVDDVKSNLDVLVEALQGHHLISIALDGESALKSIAHSPPDLVLLDLMMPRLDGYEVCRRLRADPATRELPIIFLSALGEAKSKSRAFEAGDRVTYMVDAIGGWAEIRSGAVIAIHGGRAWIKWDHGSDSLERLVNLQLEDKGEGK